MYLSTLSEEEKELFLNIAYIIANSDGNYSSDEKNMISGYCREMQMEVENWHIDESMEAIADRLQQISGLRTKKIIVFEAVGLAMVDGNYDKNEQEIISGLRKKLGLEVGFLSDCEAVLQEYIELQTKINRMILE